MRLQTIRALVLFCILPGALIGTTFMSASAQQAAVPTQASSTAPATPAPAPGELEALVAPIALYPDQLLAKVLIASTYPLEIVEAARWQESNKTVTGSALDSALAKQTWDDSVKDLVRVPEVLDMMDKQISWTQKLGDAFLVDQAAMLKAVQRLRAKAQTEGNLKDTPQQKVVTENQTIIIQPTEPEKVYVPYYNPTTVYGTWGYAAYPPYYPPPPYGYAYGAGLAFLGGMAIGAAFWGNGCNWGGGSVYANRNVNINNFNSVRGGQNWQHNVNHRKGVGYGNSQLNNRYGRGASAGANGRRDFRGFDNNGLGNRGGVGDRGGIGDRGGVGDRGGIGDRGGVGDRGGIGDRGGVGDRGGIGDRGGVGDRGGLAGNNGVGGNRGGVGGGSSNFGGNRGSFGSGGGGISNTSFNNRGSSGFSGLGSGGQTRSFSSRGNSSLGSARSSGYRGGGGGGGFRGGGGGGRGGGGRRR